MIFRPRPHHIRFGKGEQKYDDVVTFGIVQQHPPELKMDFSLEYKSSVDVICHGRCLVNPGLNQNATPNTILKWLFLS